MADKITVGQLQVRCRFTFLSILHCKIHARYGEHTVAEISGTVKGREALAILSDVTEDKVESMHLFPSGRFPAHGRWILKGRADPFRICP